MGTDNKVTQLHQYGKGGYEGTRKRIQLAIVRGEAFQSGALKGTPYDHVPLGITLGQLPDDWNAVFTWQADTIDYIVWSYQTPIAWHYNEGDALDPDRWVIPDVRYSHTTTRHQGFARVALAIAGPVESLNDARLGGD